MRSHRDRELDVARSFAGDVANHRIIIKLDQGLHRHLVFQQREHAWNSYFELITTPGSLTITGDHGAHTFRRLTDMFQFFRSNPDRPHRINAKYWAEKTSDNGRSVEVYSEDILRDQLDESLQEAIAARDAIQKEFDEEHGRQLLEWREDLLAEGIQEDEPGCCPAPEREPEWPELTKARELVDKATELIEDHDADGLLGYEDGARRLLAELEHLGLVCDLWEWDLSDWDYHFLWCLNAIAWGIQQYDLAIRSGLHVVRSPLIAWDIPLPTTPPVKPEPTEKPVPEPVKFEVTMGTAHRTGDHLVTIHPAGGVL
jgi:hypothetical protein